MDLIFLKDEETARKWKISEGNAGDLKETFNLAEAIELGAAFFVPLLEDGEPAP